MAALRPTWRRWGPRAPLAAARTALWHTASASSSSSRRAASSSARAPNEGEVQHADAQDQDSQGTAAAARESTSDDADDAQQRAKKEASLEDILGAALSPALTQAPSAEAEQAAAHAAQAQREAATTGRIYNHRLHIQSTRNNTILTFTTPNGDTLASASGGTAGFRKSQRSGYEAGYRAAFQMFAHIQSYRRSLGHGAGVSKDSAPARRFGGLVTAPTPRTDDVGLDTIWSGFGQGREAVFRALMTNEGAEIRALVKRVTDATPIKIGGVRPKKRRML